MTIQRFPGSVDTRSRFVVHDGRIFTVATSKSKAPSLYEQTREALAIINSALAEAGSSKSKVLSATIFIAELNRKSEMNLAWDEWVDRENPPQRACIGATLEGDDLVEILIT
ncbi:MAG TPA: RidA family protein [Gemmatales bacterium]|nr:RidA family protein [Gemmatales bacterium]